MMPAGSLQTAGYCVTQAIQFRLDRMLIPSAQVYTLAARCGETDRRCAREDTSLISPRKPVRSSRT